MTAPAKFSLGSKVPIHDVRTKKMRVMPDERGWLMEILRVDETELFTKFGQTYVSATYPGHTVANLRLAWSATPSIRATLRTDNLFDRRFADRADFAFGNYRYFPARGRALFLSGEFAPH